MTRPFEGVKILDFTQVLAGPYASYQLALLGADVIKVERREGEDMRRTPLDLDDFGTQQRELVARIGASQHLREVENLHAFKRSGQISFLLIVFFPSPVVGEGGAKRRMRGSLRVMDLRMRKEPLTRLNRASRD